MSSNPYSVGFAARLRTLLRRRFGGSIPSAALVARELNRFDAGNAPLSAETVRRWIRGLSTPELPRFRTLCAFLRCSPAEVSYLLLVQPEVDGGAGALAEPGCKAVPQSVRAALYSLMESADDDVLSAAYLAFLMASGLRRPGTAGTESGPNTLDDRSLS